MAYIKYMPNFVEQTQKTGRNESAKHIQIMRCIQNILIMLSVSRQTRQLVYYENALSFLNINFK